MIVNLEGLEKEWALQRDFEKSVGRLAARTEREPTNLDLAHEFWQRYLDWESKNTGFQVEFGTVPVCQLDKALVEDDHQKGRRLVFDSGVPYSQLDIIFPRLRKKLPPLGEMGFVNTRPGSRWTTTELSYDTVPEESVATWGVEGRYGASLSTFVWASMLVGRLSRLPSREGSYQGPTRHLDSGVTCSVLGGTWLGGEPIVVHHLADDLLFIAKQSDVKGLRLGLVQGVRSER